MRFLCHRLISAGAIAQPEVFPAPLPQHRPNRSQPSKGHSCYVYPAPFAVNLDAEDKNWVEPDVSVICDKNKLTDSGCSGAPDLVIEVVSASSRKMDYVLKNTLYEQAGVKEYWIVDPLKGASTVYRYQEDNSFITFYSFDTPVPVGIFDGFSITFADLLNE